MKMENGESNHRLHVVVVPLPAQGHITPMLQLARKLVTYGFRITFVNTTESHERMMNARSKASEIDNNIDFVSISDGLPEDHPRLRDVTAYCGVLMSLGPAFEELFEKLLPITYVIRDMRFSAMHAPAKKLRIPIAALVTPSAIAGHAYFHVSKFLAAGLLPLPPPPSDGTPTLDLKTLTLAPPRSAEEVTARGRPVRCLPGGSATMRVKDLPTPMLTHEIENFWLSLYRIQNPLLTDCECVIYNTFQELEKEVLDAKSGALNSNTFAVGPLVVDAEASVGSALWEEDTACVSWLDGQKRGSVLYVSFGSIATASVEQMREFASGLETSGCAFVWAVRTDLMCESEAVLLELVAGTRDHALVVPWAPQAAVLSHPAVGAFLTHCGWNSTTESVASGVPMLAWPQFADQPTNSHYITDVWKIGLELESEVRDGSAFVTKEEVARQVRRILAAEGADVEVDAIRANSRRLEVAAREAVAERGSSHTAMAAFVEMIQKEGATLTECLA